VKRSISLRNRLSRLALPSRSASTCRCPAPSAERRPDPQGRQLAIAQNPVPGFTVQTERQGRRLNGKHDPQTGATNIGQLVTDTSVFAVVGPFNSNVAQAEIPVSNAAGLIQCSPANTNPTLTKGDGRQGASGHQPDKIAYVPRRHHDDIQGQAGADIAYTVAGAKTAYVVDDTETYGKGLADQFVASFTALGGTDRRSRRRRRERPVRLHRLLTAAKAKNPGFVYFGGVTATGGGLLRKQMVQNGMGSIPFGGGDGISDGSAATASSFLNVAGADGDVNTYMTVARVHDIPDAAKFAADYKAAYGAEPGAYSASGYACAQIYLQALKADRRRSREDSRLRHHHPPTSSPPCSATSRSTRTATPASTSSATTSSTRPRRTGSTSSRRTTPPA
jgi:branched-chain amino acid transport system substrate-binding protein